MQKALNVAIISVILVAIIFTALMLILKYDEKGETNMPFKVSKISIISTADAQDVEDKNNKWNKIVELDNDIYIYIDKNEQYKKTETIERVVINNFKIIEQPKKGKISIYKPVEDKNAIFKNNDESKVEEVIYIGEQSTEIQKLQISNQGGIIAFRFANLDIGNLISNENQLEYKDLLKIINVTDEEIKSKVSFDMTIELNGGKKFKSEAIELIIPVENIVQNGKSSKEIEDLDLVFKRIEN